MQGFAKGPELDLKVLKELPDSAILTNDKKSKWPLNQVGLSTYS